MSNGTNPANGTYDLTFALFDVNSGAGQVGNTVTNSAMLVSSGLFTTTVDFGTNFPGADRWLEVGVRTNGGGSFATLSPRQKLAPAPYAIFANTASNLSGTVPLANLPATVALLNNSTTENFFAGDNAGNLTLTGVGNSGIGDFALLNNTSGSYNTANGGYALFSSTSGWGNTANGYEALTANTSGSYNTVNGLDALFFNTSGGNNTANGVDALYSNTTGSNNVANGFAAMLHNADGRYNTASGVDALYNNTSGLGNAAFGWKALYSDTLNNYNTAIGSFALYNATGEQNIGIGVDAGENVTTGTENIDIDNPGSPSDSFTTRIGNSQTKAFMAGIYGATTSGGTAVYVNSFGQLGTLTLSARFKKDIRSMNDESDVLLSLRPVAFRYKQEIDPQGMPQFGLIAEEVDKVDPELVVRDAKHQIYSVRYEAVNAMLLNEFLKQHGKVAEQTSEIKTLQKQNGLLTERLDELEAAVKSLTKKK